MAPLWEKLNQYHAEVTTHLSDQFAELNFERRKKFLLNDGSKTQIRIDLVQDNQRGIDIGYCLSTIKPVADERVGVIESLYVEPEYRNNGIGEELMRRTLGWMEEKETSFRKLAIVVGNEKVYDFYKRFGFYPRSVNFSQR